MEERLRRRGRRCCLRGRLRRSGRGRGRHRCRLSPQHHLQSRPRPPLPPSSSLPPPASSPPIAHSLRPLPSSSKSSPSFVFPSSVLAARAPARSLAQADRRGPHRRSRTFVRSRRPTKEGEGGGEGERVRPRKGKKGRRRRVRGTEGEGERGACDRGRGGGGSWSATS